MDSTTESYMFSGPTDIPPNVLKWDPHIRRAKSSDILVQYDPAIPLKDIYILSNDASPVVAKRCDFCTRWKKRCTREVLGCARCKEHGEVCRFSDTGWNYLGKGSRNPPTTSKSQSNRVGGARKEPGQGNGVQSSATASLRDADHHACLRQSLQKEAIQDTSLGGCKKSLKKRKLQGPVDSDASSVSISLAHQVRRSNGADAGPSHLSTKVSTKRPRKAPRSDSPAWKVPKVSVLPALQTRVRKAIETHPRIWSGTRAELFYVIPSLAKPGTDVIFEGVDAATIIFPGQDDSDSALGKWDDDTWNGRELIFSIVREATITCLIDEHAESNADDGSRTNTIATPNGPDEHASDSMSIERPSSPEVSLFDVAFPRPVGSQGESIGSSTMDNLKLNFAYDQPMPEFLSPEFCEGIGMVPQCGEACDALESAIRAFLDDTSLLSAMASVRGDFSATIPTTLGSQAVDDSTNPMRMDVSFSDPTPRANLSASTSVLSHSTSPSQDAAAPSFAGSSKARGVGEPSALLDNSLYSMSMGVSPSPLAPHHPRSPSRATSVVSPASTVDFALPPYPAEVARLIECLSQGELLSVILSQGSPLVPWQLSEEIGFLWAGLFRLTSIKESTQTLPSTADPPWKECSSRQSVVRRSWKVHMQWVPGGEALLHDDMDEGYLKWLQSTSLPWWETAAQGTTDSNVCADPFASSLLPLDLIAPFSATSSSGGSFPPGWYCSKCGRVNVQRHLRHRLCQSRTCIAEAGDGPQRGWAADVTSARNPCRIAVCVFPDNVYADGIVTQRRVDSADGRSVYQYRISSVRDLVPVERDIDSAAAKHGLASYAGDIDVWHLFTSNLPHAQTEPTELFTNIQREVLLERQPGATLFSASPSLLDEYPCGSQEVTEALSVRHAVRFMERTVCDNLRLETPLKISKLEIQASVAETKCRGVLHCKAAHTMLLCLGADIVLSVVRNDLKNPPPALTKSKKRDQNEVLIVTLLHGDMAVLHGDDIEYSMLHTGMSIVVIGECPA